MVLRWKIQFKHRCRFFLLVSRRTAGSSGGHWIGICLVLDLSSSLHISRISCFRFFFCTNPAFAFSHAYRSSASFCTHVMSLAASSISSCMVPRVHAMAADCENGFRMGSSMNTSYMLRSIRYLRSHGDCIQCKRWMHSFSLL